MGGGFSGYAAAYHIRGAMDAMRVIASFWRYHTAKGIAIEYVSKSIGNSSCDRGLPNPLLLFHFTVGNMSSIIDNVKTFGGPH